MFRAKMNRQILLHSSKCFGRNFCSTKPVASTENADDHEHDENYTAEAKYPKEIPSIFDENLRTNRANEEYLKTWLPHERKILANMARNLGTVKEKIEFVNPYERKWQHWEVHRHRQFHRPLTSPRKAYLLSPIPSGYNSLNLYKFVTQTHCIKKLPDLYEKVDVKPTQIAEFRERLIDILTLETRGRKDFNEVIDNVIEQIVNSSVAIFGSEYDHIKDAQIGTNVRYESFVERGGFQELYYKLKTLKDLDEERHKKKKEEKAKEKEKLAAKSEEKKMEAKETEEKENNEKTTDEKEKSTDDGSISKFKGKKVFQRRLQCDGFYRIGELSFCFRDTANAQFRWNLPLPQFLDINDPICRTPVPQCIFNPMDFALPPDPDPLWMVPGYEHGDQHEFGSLMINSFKNLRAQMKYWEAEPEELEECLTSAAISSCFSWLSGQAHYLGFNHFNDVEYPLTTQAVFTDCQDWYFAAYQLNTLDLKHKFDQNADQKCNVCWLDGPHRLFELDETGNPTNINEKILEKFLKFLFHRPTARENIKEFRPYIAKPVEKQISKAEILDKVIEQVADVVYDLPKSK